LNSTDIPIRLADQWLRLLPQRAVYWPEQRALLLADLHLGKAAAFRRAGVPVPSGQSAATLSRLSALIEHWQAARVYWLGDILHTSLATDRDLEAELHTWIAGHPGVQIHAIPGNHDAELQRLAPALSLLSEGTRRDGLALCHYPDGSTSPDQPWVAGHWHPVVRLSGGGDSMRLPAFITQDDRGLILPAFGEFTGGAPMGPASGRRRFVTTGSRVVAVDSD
jgi:DNA ligase-associated metallophosphoesterase